ncbi:MAG: GNAT family N-acetyltransferase [Candidatus Flexifilum sp.]
MTSGAAPNLIIRDAQSQDVLECLSINPGYETQFVWQLHVQQDDEQVEARLRKERLPRLLTITPSISADDLRRHLNTDHGLLVAEQRDHGIIGYLGMSRAAQFQFGTIQFLVVDQPYRRHGIGTKLIAAARKWASAYELTRLQAAISTKNYPAVEFFRQSGFVFCGFNDRYLPNHDVAVFFTANVR